jgi:indolepyruvate decarboxylase
MTLFPPLRKLHFLRELPLYPRVSDGSTGIMVYKTYTVGQYLVDRLRELGVRHLFSVPGPYGTEWLHDYVEATPEIQRFGTTNAANAGYAADGYARMNGLGAACVPHDVGTRALLPPIAGAFVERVPIVVVNGIPPADSSEPPARRPLVGGPDGNRRLYDDVTCATARLTDPAHAPAQVDHLLLSCLRHRRPVYLELQADLLHRPCSAPQAALSLSPPSPASNSQGSEALPALASALCRAESAVVWGGVELQRYGLEQEFDALLRALDVPYVTSLLGKGLLPEDHDHFAGILDAGGTAAPVRALVAEADHVLGIGVEPALHALPSCLPTARTTVLHSGPHHPGSPPATHPVPSGVALQSLLEHLRTEITPSLSSLGGTAETALPTTPNRSDDPSPQAPDHRITYQGFFDTVAPYVDDDKILVSGTGLDRWGSQSLPVQTPSGFVCQAVYGDVGHAPPAAMGADLGSGDERVILIVGDGGFQMTAQCLGTMAENGLDPLLFVLNNGVYASEQWRTDAAPFSQEVPFAPQHLLQQWHYRKLPDALGGKGWRAETYAQLTDAAEEALQYTGGPLLIDVRIRQKSLPDLAVDGVEQPDADRARGASVLGRLP